MPTGIGMEKGTTQASLLDILRVLAIGLNGKTCVGYQALIVTTSAVKLTVPTGAISAEMTLDAAGISNTNTSAAARYTVSGDTPVTGNVVTSLGVPIGEYDTLEIVGNNNLNNFKIIGATVGTNVLKIQYFG